MSLINEALQKAQAQDAQRSGAGVPASAANYQAPTPARRKPRSGGLSAGFAVGGVIVFIMVGGLGVLGSKQLTSTPQPAEAKSIFTDPHAEAHPADAKAITEVVAEVREKPKPVAPPSEARQEPKVEAKPAAAVADATPAARPAPVDVPSRPQSIELFADSVYASRPLPVDTEMPPPKVAPKPEVEAKFDPQSAVIPVVGKVKLAAIVRSPNGARAMINTSIVGVGDTIGPAEVIAIEAKRVKLRVDGKTYTLQMP